ncbi:fibronectin type 3 and ankyrin repeat domains protein 1 isoform X7 [Pan troglodytes]|uniref:fibronectin type 3 and ankyrin repeat domains protein 1 isoform X7 n=2 Tax=Pan troglodytes TaxID=9598 RepID=UPI0023F2E22D|nr:fibronectin type 3 and ankyrin repeat domains protein 1 isoform X17 [Pan troglodytes]
MGLISRISKELEHLNSKKQSEYFKGISTLLSAYMLLKREIMPPSKPHPPVVGKVTHHSIELYWDLEKKAKRQGPQEQWFRFSIEEEDPKMHTYGIIYTGYATKHVVEGLEPRTLYRFRLKVTSPSGDCEYSPLVSVSTTREPISSEHLHQAVSVNDEDLLVRILQGGRVKVDVPNKFGFTALMVAAQKGYTRLVKILVSNGTDVNLKNGSGKDSLMLACYAGHLDVVKYLRRHGASWQARDLGGCTALHWAADGGHCSVIEWMIKDGCEVDVVDTGSGWTPLMRVSAVSGNQRVASLLIDAGANVNVKDRNGKTPLMTVFTSLLYGRSVHPFWLTSSLAKLPTLLIDIEPSLYS